MAYDSGLFFPSDYRNWMAYQVRTAAQALEGLRVHFLIGLPTSEENTPSHNITTEYLANALYGFYEGLRQSANPNTIDGIAIYPHWETDEAEWALLATLPSD